MIGTILFILVIMLSIQYVVTILLFIVDSTEKEMRWKVINSKRRFMCWVIPFGYMVILYFYITNLWKELKDN